MENSERVFVTWIVRPVEAPVLAHIEKMRAARIIDADGNVVTKTGMLAFGTQPNPDADDGTEIGTFLDVTRP